MNGSYSNFGEFSNFDALVNPGKSQELACAVDKFILTEKLYNITGDENTASRVFLQQLTKYKQKHLTGNNSNPWEPTFPLYLGFISIFLGIKTFIFSMGFFGVQGSWWSFCQPFKI